MADDNFRPSEPVPARRPPGATPADGVAAGSPPAAKRTALFLPRPKSGKSAGEPKDSFREIVETIVFVIVLVLMLKTFVAEAFVIPTGSMATTLLGYHRNVTCPSCGYTFPVNISAEVDPQNRIPETITGCTCPNCRLHISFDLKNQQTDLFP
jgi:hypothetical protein